MSAASAMHLQANQWDSVSQQNTKEFLVWVKKEVLAGHPVITAVFTNENLFYGDTNPKAGEEEYDHIVPVTGIKYTDNTT